MPWKRNRGYARRTLQLLLPIAHELGLSRLLITCDADNLASCRAIEATGGIAAGEAPHPEHPDKRKLLFWVNTVA